MFCKNCGSNISDDAVICPHCGVPVNSQGVRPAANGQASQDGNAVAIVGFVMSFFVALAGLICSIIGYRKAVNEGAPHKGLALAGIIISAVNMFLGLIISIIWGSALMAVLAAA